MRRLLTALLSAVVLLAPASAAGDTAQAEVTYELFQKSTDQGVHTLIIEAPKRAWGLRRIAADYDRRLPSLDIWAKRGISCDPDVSCLQVRVGNFGREFVCGYGDPYVYAGCMWDPRWVSQPGERFLMLNTHYVHDRKTRKAVACHELGHALGLDHHLSPGCVGGTGGKSPSDEEIAVLERWFSRAAQ